MFFLVTLLRFSQKWWREMSHRDPKWPEPVNAFHGTV
jgi:hypothetical protein